MMRTCKSCGIEMDNDIHADCEGCHAIREDARLSLVHAEADYRRQLAELEDSYRTARAEIRADEDRELRRRKQDVAREKYRE